MNEQTIKEQLVRAVRLGTKQDFRTKQKEFAFTHTRFHYGRTAFEILLSPCPAAAERCWRIVNRNRIRTRLYSKRRTAVEEKVRAVRHAVSKRVGIVDSRL